MFKDLFPIAWNEFHFLRPQLLWLLLPVAVLWLLSLLLMRQDVRWKKMIAPHLRPYVIAKGSNRTKVVMHILMLLGFSCAILGLAGPTWKKIEVPGQELETPMVVILDLSPSMLSEDIQPNRLERAKFKIKDLIKYNPRARMALVGFGGTAHTIVPLTKDYEIINSHIETISPKTMPFQGANLKDAMALADSLTQVTKAPGTVVLISDDFYGTERQILDNFKKNSKNSLIILPVNTPSGAEMPNNERSFLDETTLNGLSNIEGITVQRLTLDDSDVERIAKQISDNLKFTEKAEEKDNDWRDAGLLLVIPAAFILLFWFRKGWVLYGLLFVLSFSSCKKNETFADLWYTKDYQGQRLSDKQDFQSAAETYTSELRKGVAYYKSGNYEAAIAAFSKDTTAQGAYNLGLAYYQNGDLQAAQYAFNQAIERDPEFAAAQANKNALTQVLPQVDELSLGNAEEAQKTEHAKNIQNKGEDLSGGGQEATEEQMKKQRQEETTESKIHFGKELDEVPSDEDLNISKQQNSNILMRKVDDDPSLFLQRKFHYQAKKYNMKPPADVKKW
ncbi:MAG: vWA domain-containing protein [Flavobacteriaceae bacterium]